MYDPQELDRRRRTLTNCRLRLRDNVERLPAPTYMRMMHTLRGTNVQCSPDHVSGAFKADGYTFYFRFKPEGPNELALEVGLSE
jgi:hypothetical protein